jgi:cation diffusion facilitator CzcD-associated flavoprotein CzcO
MTDCQVMLVGAGPFGLSISAHLRELGVDHRIVGRPMDTWKAHCPPGLNLKSEPYGSDLAAPRSGYGLEAFSALRGLDYVARLGPVPVERFLDYTGWYTEQLVPDVADHTVTDVSAARGGFRVTFADADPVTARQVVIATGVLPYPVMPAELSGLPAELVSHTSDHHRLDHFAGRRVAVIGRGQSATETAALLHEGGAHVQVVVRAPGIYWIEPNPAQLSALGHVRRPSIRLCEGWHCAFWNSPTAFRRLPEEMRIQRARSVLGGPAAAWWLKDRVDGVLDVLTGHRLTGAVPHAGGVRLLVDGPERSTIDVDHVMAGTGFRIDIARLPYLPEALRAGIATVSGFPVLSRAGESSVAGLYFAGAPAAGSLGPGARFIAGTHTTVRPLARSLARSRNRRARPAPDALVGAG